MTNPFASWRSALAGGKPPMHESEPWCGYYATQDRSNTTVSTTVKAKKWPLIACAIWVGADGQLQAERGGKSVPVDWVWPWCASRPISYATYTHWCETQTWPEAAAA